MPSLVPDADTDESEYLSDGSQQDPLDRHTDRDICARQKIADAFLEMYYLLPSDLQPFCIKNHNVGPSPPPGAIDAITEAYNHYRRNLTPEGNAVFKKDEWVVTGCTQHRTRLWFFDGDEVLWGWFTENVTAAMHQPDIFRMYCGPPYK